MIDVFFLYRYFSFTVLGFHVNPVLYWNLWLSLFSSTDFFLFYIFLQSMGPDSLMFIRNLLDKLTSNQQNILKFIACNEIFLMPATVFMLFRYVHDHCQMFFFSSLPRDSAGPLATGLHCGRCNEWLVLLSSKFKNSFKNEGSSYSNFDNLFIV